MTPEMRRAFENSFAMGNPLLSEENLAYYRRETGGELCVQGTESSTEQLADGSGSCAATTDSPS
jgi:hypothetical protein